jgi:hypothetical protein
MPNLKLPVAAALVLASLWGPTGCALGNGPVSPPIISPLGVSLTPLKEGRVHLTVLPQTASPSLRTIFVRVERGSAIVLKQSMAWDYSQGAQADLGGPDQPLQGGDRVVLGAGETDNQASVTVSP